MTRRNWNVQLCLFVTLCASVWALQPLNDFLSAHHKDFATQNYFDKRGIFVTVMFAAPVLLILVLQVVRVPEPARGVDGVYTDMRSLSCSVRF